MPLVQSPAFKASIDDGRLKAPHPNPLIRYIPEVHPTGNLTDWPELLPAILSSEGEGILKYI